MPRPNGHLPIRNGSFRFLNPKTGTMMDISPFITTVTTSVGGWQTARDDVQDGPLLGVGPRGEDSVTVTGILTKGESANPEGDWYDVVWYAFENADCVNLPCEWSHLNAKNCDPQAAQPFDATDQYWLTVPTFSRVTAATSPEITRSGATSKTVQFTVSTELLSRKAVA